MSNYRKYKMGFSKYILLKKDALPSKFSCQQDHRKGRDSEPAMEQQRLTIMQESEQQLQPQVTATTRTTPPKLDEIYNNTEATDIQLEQFCLMNTAAPSVFLKPVTSKIITPSCEPIPFVNVPATDPLQFISEEQPKVAVKIETEVKEEIDPMLTVCRTCLSENAVTNLSDMCDEACTLRDMLEKITGVCAAEGLPDNICYICTSDLQSAIAFRRRAQNADKTLRQHNDITSAGDSLLPIHNVKCEFPETEMLEPNSSNIVSTEENKVCKSPHSDDDYTAPTEDNQSDVDWKPNGKAPKRPHSSPRKVPNITKTANVRGQLLYQKAKHKNKIPSVELRKGIGISSKKPLQQVVKLKAIDKNQIPLSQLKKLQMIKLKPVQQKGPVEGIVNTSISISPDASGIVQSVPKSVYKPPLKRQKIMFDEPVRNTVKSFKFITNEPESSQDTEQGTFSCPHQGCSRTFMTHKLMLHHKYASHLSENRLFLCLTCGKKSDTRQKALNHLKVHKTDNKKAVQMNCRIQCELCGIFFPVESQLERHISRMHKVEREHKCTECDRRFFLHHAMVMHRKSQHLPMTVVQSGENNSDNTQNEEANTE